MRSIHIILLSVVITFSSIYSGNIINEEVKEVQRTILYSFANSIFVDGNGSGTEYKWLPSEDVIIYDKGNVEIYNTENLKDEFAKESFLNESSSYELTTVKIDGKNACAVVEVYNGTSHSYTNFITLHKFDDRWDIITKVFYSHQ